MGRGDEGDVVRARSFQFAENVGEFPRRDVPAPLRAGDFVILAEYAAEIAPAEKNRTASLFEGNARFFEGVEVIFCDFEAPNAAGARAD